MALIEKKAEEKVNYQMDILDYLVFVSLVILCLVYRRP